MGEQLSNLGTSPRLETPEYEPQNIDFGTTLIDSCLSKISPGHRVELILQVTLNMERNRAKPGTHLTWVRHCAKQRGAVKREFSIIEHNPYPKVIYILVLKARLIKNMSLQCHVMSAK